MRPDLPCGAGFEGGAELADRRRTAGHEPVQAVDPDHVGRAAGREDDRLAGQPVPLRATVLEPAAEFAVGIRSGLVRGRRLALFSGAGIVAGSKSDEEWAEIEQKIEDFTGAFGLGNRAR